MIWNMKESWSQTVNIPLALAGPPLNKEGVSFFKVMFNASSWSQENEKHQKLTFWDPDKMHQWVEKKVAQTPENFSVLTIKGTKGVVIDKSHLPTPQESIWLQQLDPNNPKTTVKN